MPRYYFDLLDGEDVIKNEGMELPDIGSAQATSLGADQANHCSK
jgi:hypothetical protein